MKLVFVYCSLKSFHYFMAHLKHLKVPVISWWLNVAIPLKEKWPYWYIVTPDPQFSLIAFSTGLSSMSSCNQRYLSEDTNQGEESWVFSRAAFYSFSQSVVGQSMNKCMDYLLDVGPHAFIFCMNESPNPCLQRSWDFVRRQRSNN